MIKYHYNKEKQVIVAFFCEDVSRKFEGKIYWYRNIIKSIWKVFCNGLIDYEKFIDIVKSAVDSVEVVSKVKAIINNINCLNNENNCGNIYSVILLESAILFQVEDLVKLCDEIWYVEARETDRRERLKRERGYSEERIEAMSISQECIRRMKDKCDRVIINDRDIVELDNSLFSL